MEGVHSGAHRFLSVCNNSSNVELKMTLRMIQKQSERGVRYNSATTEYHYKCTRDISKRVSIEAYPMRTSWNDTPTAHSMVASVPSHCLVWSIQWQ